MPILDIFDTSGEPKPYARLTVIAAMCFPGSDDSVQRAGFSTAFASDKISQWEISQLEVSHILGQEQISEMIAEVFPDWARGFDAEADASRRMFERFGGHRALARNPRGVKETIDHAIENRAYRAGYAGGILIFLLAQDKACQGDASLRAVLSVFSQHARWSEKKSATYGSNSAESRTYGAPFNCPLPIISCNSSKAAAWSSSSQTPNSSGARSAISPAAAPPSRCNPRPTHGPCRPAPMLAPRLLQCRRLGQSKKECSKRRGSP